MIGVKLVLHDQPGSYPTERVLVDIQKYSLERVPVEKALRYKLGIAHQMDSSSLSFSKRAMTEYRRGFLPFPQGELIRESLYKGVPKTETLMELTGIRYEAIVTSSFGSDALEWFTFIVDKVTINGAPAIPIKR